MYVRAISMRLLHGRSTPASRAIPLPPPLLVARVGAQHAHHARAADHLALLADRPDRSPHLHFESLTSLGPSLTLASYLVRAVIRPRERSSGEISTVTLSPGAMRRYRMRSAPETWASTWWPLSSSTRTSAFGMSRETVPLTAIASPCMSRRAFRVNSKYTGRCRSPQRSARSAPRAARRASPPSSRPP